MQLRILLILISLLVGYPSGLIKAQTIDSVTGTIEDGQTVTIGGSSFGTKSQAAPILWDTFENGQNGVKINDANAIVGDWDTGLGYDVPEYSDVVAHSGNMSSYHNFLNTHAASLSKNGLFPTVYIDFWMYVSYPGEKSRNWKPWRLYGDNDNMQTNWVWYCDGQAYSVYHSCGINQNYWGGPTFTNNNWYHFQISIDESTPSVADGTIQQFINYVRTPPTDDNLETRCANTSYGEIRIGSYWAHDAIGECLASEGGHVYIDNVYIDITFTRVEIGDNSSYDSCTHREIQVPTFWATNSINVTFNQGSFNPGETVYFYIINENGEANTSGYPVIIGAVTCSDYNGNQSSCESNGCVYCTADTTCNDSECCGDDPLMCLDQSSCETASWYWCSGACQCTPCPGETFTVGSMPLFQ